MSAGAVSATGAAGAVGTVGLRGAMVLPSLVDVTRDTKPSVILGQITWDSPCNFFFLEVCPTTFSLLLNYLFL